MNSMKDRSVQGSRKVDELKDVVFEFEEERKRVDEVRQARREEGISTSSKNILLRFVFTRPPLPF